MKLVAGVFPDKSNVSRRIVSFGGYSIAFRDITDSMYETPAGQLDEVEQLLLNAQLRTELEPFLDESVDLVDLRRMSTPSENEYLASMLAWERAPVLAISQWFEPELKLARPDELLDEELSRALSATIELLYSQRIVLEFTDHLNDRQLYCLIYRDILPACEKKVDLPRNYLHWHCIDADQDIDTWLRYYATDDEREHWQNLSGGVLPKAEVPPYSRRMPRKP